MRIITVLIAILFLVVPGYAITITVGGNVEDIAVKTDQITVDLCSYVYDCGQHNMVSLAGKANTVQPGSLDKTNLKALYAPNANRAEYSEYTEKASWAITGKSDSTAYSAAFSAQNITDQIANNSFHSQKALGGDYAPGADQSVVTLHNTQTVGTLKRIDFYEYSDRARGAVVSNDVTIFEGSYVFDKADTAIQWTIDIPGTY